LSQIAVTFGLEPNSAALAEVVFSSPENLKAARRLFKQTESGL